MILKTVCTTLISKNGKMKLLHLLDEINELINNPNTAFHEEQIKEIVTGSKRKALNKAKLLKRKKKEREPHHSYTNSNFPEYRILK